MNLLRPLPILLLAVAGAGCAQVAAAEIEVHKVQSARYVSRGVTPDEVNQVKKLAARFPTQLYLAAQCSDVPVTGINMTVRDIQSDTVLQA